MYGYNLVTYNCSYSREVGSKVKKTLYLRWCNPIVAAGIRSIGDIHPVTGDSFSVKTFYIDIFFPKIGSTRNNTHCVRCCSRMKEKELQVNTIYQSGYDHWKWAVSNFHKYVSWSFLSGWQNAGKMPIMTRRRFKEICKHVVFVCWLSQWVFKKPCEMWTILIWVPLLLWFAVTLDLTSWSTPQSQLPVTPVTPVTMSQSSIAWDKVTFERMYQRLKGAGV